MGAFSDDLSTKLLNATLRNTSYTSPTTVYVALYTSNPTSANTGTEVSGGSYARASMAFGAPSGSPLTCTNSALVSFTTATASWGTVAYFAIFDALSSGNMLYYGALSSSKTIGSGDTAQFAASAVTVSLS